MSDADLEEIRKGRLAQLQQQQASSTGRGSGASQDDQRKFVQSLAYFVKATQLTKVDRQQEAEARASILSQVLTPEAADRLGRIRLVKESRATDVENRLIMLARSGQLRGKVTEEQLKDLLGAMAKNKDKLGGGGGGGGRIVVNRRTDWDDEDDLLDL